MKYIVWNNQQQQQQKVISTFFVSALSNFNFLYYMSHYICIFVTLLEVFAEKLGPNINTHRMLHSISISLLQADWSFRALAYERHKIWGVQ